MIRFRGTWLVALVAVLAVSTSARATQHLVRAGHPWQQLTKKVRPGDEIILMPGVHRPAFLKDLRGTKDAPIVIRGLDPRAPTQIEADRHGIRLRDPYSVRLANLHIIGARINGIHIERVNGDDASKPVGRIEMENVRIERTGPRGQRHALLLDGLEDVTIENCSFEGWAGSAMEIVGCRFVTISGCRLLGKEDYQQRTGIRLRAGTTDATIGLCRFENTGDQGISIGGGSELDEFVEAPPEDAPGGTLFEATRVNVNRSVFIGAECAVSFVNCSSAQVTYCTIAHPRRAIVSVRNEQADPRFSPASNCRFGHNLVTWKAGSLASLTHLGPGAVTTGISLQENLWWSPDFQEMQASLGAFPGTAQFDQITNVDPELDEELKPMVVGAEIFGAHAP
jgi:hypothetical protein